MIPASPKTSRSPAGFDGALGADQAPRRWNASGIQQRFAELSYIGLWPGETEIDTGVKSDAEPSTLRGHGAPRRCGHGSVSRVRPRVRSPSLVCRRSSRGGRLDVRRDLSGLGLVSSRGSVQPLWRSRLAVRPLECAARWVRPVRLPMRLVSGSGARPHGADLQGGALVSVAGACRLCRGDDV
jgi:hypothetical protein